MLICADAKIVNASGKTNFLSEKEGFSRSDNDPAFKLFKTASKGHFV
jgi:hypothetical protein